MQFTQMLPLKYDRIENGRGQLSGTSGCLRSDDNWARSCHRIRLLPMTASGVLADQQLNLPTSRFK